MPRKAINPQSMYPSVQFGFSHATESGAGRTLHLAGQVAWDKELNLVGPGDLAAQARQALENLKTVLSECGATPADVVRLRTYVVNYSADAIPAIGAALAEFYGDVTPAANTLLGVQALAMPEFLIEIEATAVVD
jgi:enamine deaminase RidA (YjgF/YER057c/UK114 family)